MYNVDKELERLKAAGYVVEDDTAKLLRTVQEENLEIGEKRGIRIGKTEGIEIGEKRGIKSVVKNMLKHGMEADEVAKIANVDRAMVEKLAKKIVS